MRVSFPPKEIVFNRFVMMDLKKIDAEQVLHVVEKDTLFRTAVILSERESTKSVWDAYVHSWVNVYAAYSNEIHDDQGPQFQCTEWNFLLQAAGIRKIDPGNEIDNALGVGEICYDFLKSIYKKFHAEHPTIPKKIFYPFLCMQ